MDGAGHCQGILHRKSSHWHFSLSLLQLKPGFACCEASKMTSASIPSALGIVGTGSMAGPVLVRQGSKVKE